MTEFVVRAREMVYCEYSVEAETPEDAETLAVLGKGTYRAVREVVRMDVVGVETVDEWEHRQKSPLSPADSHS